MLSDQKLSLNSSLLWFLTNWYLSTDLDGTSRVTRRPRGTKAKEGTMNFEMEKYKEEVLKIPKLEKGMEMIFGKLEELMRPKERGRREIVSPSATM